MFFSLHPYSEGSGLVNTGQQRKGAEEVTFVLQHAFEDGTFSPAGVFNARAQYSRENEDAVRLSHLKLQREPMTEDARAKFEVRRRKL